MWIPQNLTYEKSKSAQVMNCWRQATRHYLSQCWSRFMSPYVVTWPIAAFKKITNMINRKWFLFLRNRYRYKRKCIWTKWHAHVSGRTTSTVRTLLAAAYIFNPYMLMNISSFILRNLSPLCSAIIGIWHNCYCIWNNEIWIGLVLIL